MKINIPLFGQIKTGKDAETPLAVTTIEVPTDKKGIEVLGGMLDLNRFSLSNEKTISHKLLEANREWIYRNNDVIAQEVAAIEFELFSIDIKNGEIEYNQIDDHPLLDLLDRFNSRTTKTDGIYMTQSHKKMTGDAFWLLDKNGGVVQNIFILPPDKIELVLGDPTKESGDIIKQYLYRDTIDGKQIEQTYDVNDIIHFKKPNPSNPFRGIGAVEALADTIDTDAIANEVQKNFFNHGAIGNFVLTSEFNITQDQLKRLKGEMQAAYGGAKNAFKAMIFGNGLKPVDIGFSNKDMDFLNLLEWYRDKIMVGFGNTKASLGIIDDVNRASHESSMVGWLRGTVKPDMNSIVQTINEFLVPMYGENLLLGFVDPVPQNVTEDTVQAVQLKKAGIIQINEAREMVSLSPIEGGDVFAPDSSDQQPVQPTEDDPNAPAVTDPSNEDDSASKRYALRQASKKNLPASLRHFDIEPIIRRRGVYFRKKINKQLKEEAKPIIREILSKKKGKKENTISTQFTDDVITEYYAKQDNIVQAFENQFHDKVLKLLDQVKDQALSNLETEVKSIKGLKKFMVTKELFDEDEIKTQAQIDLTPILMQEVILAGQEAYKLIGVEDTYIPYKIEAAIRQVVDRFATSMLSTDKDQLASIISNGIEAGDSITDIRNSITSKFGDYTKMQAERITRTEVLRSASMAAEDAFIQSGVVEAKQWLVAPSADAECLPYAGKIVKLNSNFYSPDDSGFQNGNPPIHVNCRCQLIPIVKGAAGYHPDYSKKLEDMATRIVELEKLSDKRTKDFKDAQRQYKQKEADDAAYIKALESNLGINDD